MTSVSSVTYNDAVTIFQWLNQKCPIVTSNNTYPAIFLYKLNLNICAFNKIISEYEMKRQNIMTKYGDGTDDYNNAHSELLNTKVQISVEIIYMKELKNIKMSYTTLKNLSFMITK